MVFLLPAAGAAFWVWGFAAYANHDRVELLDLPRVDSTAESACVDVAQALATTARFDRAEGLAAGNAAIDELIAAMTALGFAQLEDDRPAVDWIADWQALKAARQDLADELGAQPEASLEIPQTSDGYPITRRMIYASGPACEDVITLAARP